MSRRQCTNQLGGIHKPCGPVGGGCKVGLSKVHMVEEGGLSKVHISSQGGGWGELFTAQFFHFYSAVTSLKNQICLTTIRFLAVANNSSDTNVYRYILIKRT